MKNLQYWENLHNRLSDFKFVWLPFIFLRPSPATPITTSRILLMALFFGFYYNFFGFIHAYFIMNISVTFFDFFTAQFFWTIGFFVWFRFVTAYFWNRRANTILTRTAIQSD